MNRKRVVVVGAGPGGLAAAMLLANKGFKVTVLEKEEEIGGRNAALNLGDYTFDVGPTFLMMRFILDEIFREVNRRPEQYLEFVDLEPMYSLAFSDRQLDIYSSNEPERERDEIARVFEGHEDRIAKFYDREKRRFEALMPALRRGYNSLLDLASPEVLRALPHLSPGKSLFDVLQSYFDDEKLTLSFTFQAKYLGMSPWNCPGAFAIVPYIEHNFGMYHVIGGLNRISHAFADVVREEGGVIYTGCPVQELIIEGREVKGVRLESGEEIFGDYFVVNADFAYAMSSLVAPGILKKYSRKKLAAMDYSCSTFMLYLGLDRLYDVPHHRVFFAEDYRTNVDDIFERQIMSGDFSLYVHNPSITDPTLAPEGHSAVYMLVPVSNNESKIDWEMEKAGLREKILQVIEDRGQMDDIQSHIREEKIITPWDWDNDYNVYRGATFNLSHKLSQMLAFRPHNRFQELKNVYLAGGGTSPGSGLPTIYQSAVISSDYILEDSERSGVG